MTRKTVAIILFGAVLFTAAACASPNANKGDDPDQPGQPTVEFPQTGVDVPGFESNAHWPAYIPGDIPVFDGKILRVFETGDRIRIIYENITLDQLKAYLRLLEKQGFHLEYIVYVEEGFPDNSEERMKKGDYDAVDITRGDYHMNIGYGEGIISYDIDTAGFADQIPTPSGLAWPADLVNVVPQPERCLVETIFPIPPSGYQINCRPADEQVASNYIQALKAAGYMEEYPGGTTSFPVYARDDLGVSVRQHSTIVMSIEISQFDRTNTTWPPALAGKLPAPPGCPVNNVLNTGNMEYLISCEAEREQVIAEYIDLLSASGFVETRRMETQEGELVSVSFMKSDLKVQLMISPPLRMMIKVSEN